ncbi:MAG: hypothetical protein P4M11_02710 [Candidatus Pacebacteria bacterium]|nr:hypothetical protein [Candidatus Paceibacterota bacterium]
MPETSLGDNHKDVHLRYPIRTVSAIALRLGRDQLYGLQERNARLFTGLKIKQKFIEPLVSYLTPREKQQEDFVAHMNTLERSGFVDLGVTASVLTYVYDTLAMSIVEVDVCAPENKEYSDLFKRLYHLTELQTKLVILKNFKSNFNATKALVVNATSGFKNGSFRNSGMSLGLLMLRVLNTKKLEGGEDMLTPYEYLKLIKGLLKGLNVKSDVEEVLKCVNSVPEFIAEIAMIIDKIRTMNVKSIAEVVKLIQRIINDVKSFLKELSACAKSVTELEAIIEKMTHLDAKKVMQRLIRNFLKLKTYATEAVVAWTEKAYEVFGEKLGAIIYLVLLE